MEQVLGELAAASPGAESGTENSATPRSEDVCMFKWALIFLVISLVAGALGFTGLAAGAARISKILFAIFFAIFLVVLILAFAIGDAVF
jgi:uncharacterized membrane protein YtjA (UPF0391 family)